jgi:broad specificity phosphatase PhoE
MADAEENGTELVLVCIGETALHAVRTQGSEESPFSAEWRLTAKGVAQAEALAWRLWRSGNKPITALYSSPLGCAQETAQAILAGRPATEPAVSMHTEARLGVEAILDDNFGVIGGLNAQEVSVRYAEVATMLAADDNWAPPGGESYTEVRKRAMAALAAIAKRHPGKRVLVVTHAEVVANIGDDITGGSRGLSMKNAALSLIRWDHGRWSLVLWGDTGEFCVGCRPGYYIVDTAAALRLLGVGVMAGAVLGLGIGAVLARGRSRR